MLHCFKVQRQIQHCKSLERTFGATSGSGKQVVTFPITPPPTELLVVNCNKATEMDTAESPTLALLGTGIFAKDAYLKFLGVLSGKFTLSYVWSRSQVCLVFTLGAEKPSCMLMCC